MIDTLKKNEKFIITIWSTSKWEQNEVHEVYTQFNKNPSV